MLSSAVAERPTESVAAAFMKCNPTCQKRAAGCARAEAGQGDHGGHTDDHAQGRQDAARGVGFDGPPCDLNGLKEIHSAGA